GLLVRLGIDLAVSLRLGIALRIVLFIVLDIVLGARVLFVVLLVGGLFFFLVLVGLLDGLADRDSVVEAQHHDNDIRVFGCENALGCGGPVSGLTLGLILDQAGGVLHLPDHAHLGLLVV